MRLHTPVSTDVMAPLGIYHATQSLNTKNTYRQLPAKAHSKLNNPHAPRLRELNLRTNPP
eukprot:5001157-Alexandrium_andersonii.AAC.2